MIDVVGIQIQAVPGNCLSVLLGGGTCLLVLAFLYCVGASVLRILRFAPLQGGVQHTCATGAAVFLGAAWYGLKWEIPIPSIVWAICIALIVLQLLFRNSHIFSSPGKKKAYGIAYFIVNFYAFYLLAYCLVPASMFDAMLPYRLITMNRDLFHYVNTANYFLHFRFENIAPGYYFGEAYWVTPGAYHFLALIGMICGGNVLAASMPLIYGSIALVGVAISRCLREIFDAPRLVSFSVASIVISGVFFQYVFGSGFLAQYVASVVAVFGVLQISLWICSGTLSNWRTLVLLLLPYFFLTFYTYPAICIIFIATASLLVCWARILTILAVLRDTLRPGQVSAISLKVAVWWASVVVVIFLLLGIFDPAHFYEIVLGYVPRLGGAKVGWQLDLLPLYMMLGIAGPMQLSDDWSRIWVFIGLAIVVPSFLFYLIRSAAKATIAQSALVILSACSWFVYLAWYAKVGSSYQQWKMAAYLPLLFSFVLYASTGRILNVAWNRLNFPASRVSGWVGSTICCGLALIAVGANVTERAQKWAADQRHVSAYATLRTIPQLAPIDDLYVHTHGWSETMLMAYFVDSLRLHFLSPSYYPEEQYDPQKIDARHPLFWEGGECDGADAASIGGIGCLLRRPPLMQLDRIYEFGVNGLPAVDLQGGTPREIWGRWAAEPHTRVVAYGATEATQVQRAYLNLRVSPYPEGGRARLRLGSRSSSAITIDRECWLSIPYTPADWADGNPAKLVVDLDAVSAHEMDSGNPDTRALGWGLLAASLSRGPRGEVIALGLGSDGSRSTPTGN